MSNPRIYKNDHGMVFRLALKDQDGAPVDLTGATVTLLVFVKPDANDDGRPGSVSGDPIEGIVTYTAETDLFDQAGEWEVQTHVVTPVGSFRSTPVKFTVYEPIY